MMIDTHCHFDMMSNPKEYIKNAENLGNTIIGMTNLPSHFQMGYEHVQNLHHIRLALGFHPQLAAKSIIELPMFDKLVDKTSYIGEIGLDFSKENYYSKDKQIECLRHILGILQGKKKIISVHSRRAEKELLGLLEEFNIKNVIFHWYSGSVDLIKNIVEQGYYFSINEAMILTRNGQNIISKIPRDRILTETDAPFNKLCSIPNVLKYLGLTNTDVRYNLMSLIKNIR